VLDAPNHQGKFGQDYVRVLASAAGLLVYEFDLDRDGIDLGLRFPGRLSDAASPGIEVQVKSWSTPRPSAGLWRYDGLNEEQFNKLAGDDYSVPRYLFLVQVPSDRRAYADIGPDGMLLRYLGYFQSFQQEPRIAQPDRRRRRPVQVPTANVLTVHALHGLVHPGLSRLVSTA
jgi:hypothetical protein